MRADPLSTPSEEAREATDDLVALVGQYWSLRRSSLAELVKLIRLESVLAIRTAAVLFVLAAATLLLLGMICAGLHALIMLGLLALGVPLYAALGCVLMIDIMAVALLFRQSLMLIEGLSFANTRRAWKAPAEQEADNV